MTSGGRPPSQAADAVERAFDRATGSRPIPGNAVSLLFDGPAAFEAMLAIIAGAERWIQFDNYIFRSDLIGIRFAEALGERARAGVAVRVSVDWLGSFSTKQRLWRMLESSGVSLQFFHRPGFLDLPSFLSRHHRKLVVVDGRRAVIGGICIGDEWSGDPARGRLPWRDTAVAIDGPAAAALDRAFARAWVIGAGRPLPDDEFASEVEEAGSAFVRVLAGEPEAERAYRVSELLLATAADRVWVTDAYLVAPRRLYRYLVDAAREGVDVRLLVPGTSDLPAVRNLTRFGYRNLIQAGVRIYEWGGPMLHAKTVVADGRWVRIGSSNLNHSSLVSNYELDVLVDAPKLAEQMEQQFRRDIDRSAEVTTRPNRAPGRLGAVLPPALTIPPTGSARVAHTRGVRERRGRSVLAMRTLVAGARLALYGPLSIGLAVGGILFILFPKPMAITFGSVSIWLAIMAGAEAVRRRRDRADLAG